jgi:hypothetical protein
MYKHKTQVYIKLENIGLGYFDSIQINDPEQWRDRLPEYVVEKEKYDRWVAMYGTETFINVVFHNDYCSGKNLVNIACHLMEMATKLRSGELDINPFLRSNWEFGSRNLPGICVYNEPETAIAFLHAYISGSFTSRLAAHCSSGIPFFELVNRSIYDDQPGAGVIYRFDELDNNDGILLVDMVSKKYCFMMTDTFDPSNAKVEYEKFVPISALDYLLAFHPVISDKDAKTTKVFKKSMIEFNILTAEDVREWFPEMQERIPVQARIRLKGLKTPPVFEDAQELSRRFPDTFEAPSQDVLARITIKSLLKVCALVPQHIQAQRSAAGLQGIISERFWVRVTATDGDKITAVVDNLTQFVELNAGDEISFEQRHVYQIK